MPYLSTPLNPASRSSLDGAWLLGITLLATFLRLYRLGDWSFWGDELFTVSGQEDGFDYVWLYRSTASALVQWWTSQSGISEWHARIVPALIGIATIPLFYYFVKQLFSREVALTAALLLALSPWHIYWSQNARFYTLLLLFATAASVYFYRGITEKRSDLLLLGTLFLTLAARERLLAFLLVPPAVIFIALRLFSFKRDGHAVSMRGVLLLLLIPLVTLMFTWPYVSNLATWMAGFGYPNSSPFRLGASVVFYLTMPVVLFGLGGALYGITQKTRAMLWFFLMGSVPLLTLAALTPFHYVANRYAFVTLTSWIILAAFGLVALAQWLRLREASWLLVVVSVLALSQSIFDAARYFGPRMGNRADWRGALVEVQGQIESDALVVSSDHDLADFYIGRKTHAIQQRSLDEIRTSTVPIWLVADLVVVEQYAEVLDFFGQNAALVTNHDVHIPGRSYPMRIYHYQP